MAKVPQKVELTDIGMKEIRGDFSSMGKLVDSHITTIKKNTAAAGETLSPI